jgi:beta-catenin-like protein 1
MITNLKDTLNKNLELRLKHRDDPEQFLDSEAEVHIALK